MSDLLQQIQELQFNKREEAERLLLGFINATFPELDAVACGLRPQAVSLNSFNGIVTLRDGRKKFFKTHTETDTVIDEVYNAGLLAEAGYPVVQPTHSSTRVGQHLLIYDLIEAPSVFDLAWRIERGEDLVSLPALTAAQNAADDQLLTIYRETRQDSSAQVNAKAPIHQLFYHRLTGGRLRRFYGDGTPDRDPVVQLPDGPALMSEVRQTQWSINGQTYTETLNDMIGRATTLLAPTRAGLTVVGHGDAHNGNVFFVAAPGTQPSLRYFDPAFAGRHHPLLDLVKPLFHNVFAMWMYYPETVKTEMHVSIRRDGDIWMITTDYALHPVRLMFLQSKVERTLIPLVEDLARSGRLPDDWRAMLKAALFCCPFLTLNLGDAERFPPEISLLGLTMAVEMGGTSSGERSLIDRTLDEVERTLL